MRLVVFARALLALSAGAVIGFCQRPVIYPNGVVNAASYYRGPTDEPFYFTAASGSIASIFGTNLAATAASAAGVPLPTSLGGTSVTVNGVAAPLFYVSPNQINVQVPLRFPPPGSTPVPGFVVTTPAGTSDPAPLGFDGGFGIFTLDASGCGPGAILNVAGDGTVSLNSPANSVSPGDFITIFGTGLGAVYFYTTPDGSPAPSSPLSPALNQPLIAFNQLGGMLDEGLSTKGSIAGPSFAGRAPGFVGVDQINVRVPMGVREGCAVPIVVDDADVGTSQAVPISIHTGGGPCVDPPTAGYGQLTLERSFSSGTTPGGETDTLAAVFPASPGLQAPPATPYMDGYGYYNYIAYGPRCLIPGYGSLDAGTISVTGPGFGPVQATAGVVNGQTAYRAVLPAGAVQPGSFSVVGTGGSGAGAFQSSVQVGSGIQVTSSFPPGAMISDRAPLTVNWTGGDPNAWVTITLVSHYYGIDDSYRTQWARASHGTATVYPVYGGLGVSPGQPGQAEIIVEVAPDPSQVPAFDIPGVSLGAKLSWKYTYHFAGLTLQ